MQIFVFFFLTDLKAALVYSLVCTGPLKTIGCIEISKKKNTKIYFMCPSARAPKRQEKHFIQNMLQEAPSSWTSKYFYKHLSVKKIIYISYQLNAMIKVSKIEQFFLFRNWSLFFCILNIPSDPVWKHSVLSKSKCCSNPQLRSHLYPISSLYIHHCPSPWLGSGAWSIMCWGRGLAGVKAETAIDSTIAGLFSCVTSVI